MADSQLDLDLALIRKRAIAGVVTFTLRTFFLQAFTFIATFVLTILLEPSIFGVFFVVSSLINLLAYFSDIGLAAALIQKKEYPTQRELSTVFVIQQTIVIGLVVLGLLFSTKIASFYKLDNQGLFLIRVIIFSLFLSSLKTIPSIIIERRLKFSLLVVPQVAENIVFYSVAVILAIFNFEIASFTWAVLLRGIVGLVLIYIISPWVPSLIFNLGVAKRLIYFGVPFQVNSILALVKDDLLTLFLGKVLSFSQLGYVGWAQKWANTPLRFFTDNVAKISFPVYARLQGQKKELSIAIEKSLFFVSYLVFPSVLGILVIAPMATEVIPNYEKWRQALPLLYLFGVGSLFSSISTTFTNTLFALGKPKIVLKLMIFWTSTIWVFTIILVSRIGYVGVGLSSMIIAITSMITIYFVKKEVPLEVGRNIFGPLMVSLIMFLVLKVISLNLTYGFSSLIFLILFGIIFYFVFSLAILKRRLTENIMIILSELRRKK